MCDHRYLEDQIKVRYFKAENIFDLKEECLNEEVFKNNSWKIPKKVKRANLLWSILSMGTLMEEMES